MSSVR